MTDKYNLLGFGVILVVLAAVVITYHPKQAHSDPNAPNFHKLEYTNNHNEGPDMAVYHDDKRHVTCWALGDNISAAISCMSDPVQ